MKEEIVQEELNVHAVYILMKTKYSGFVLESPTHHAFTDNVLEQLSNSAFST